MSEIISSCKGNEIVSGKQVDSKNNKITLVFITDENYAMPTAVAITSLLENKDQNSDYLIYIVSVGLADETKAKLKILSGPLFDIQFIDVEKNKYVDLEISGRNASNSSIYKLDLPNILPNDCQKVLYMDGDVLIQSDLKELFNINIENVFAGVIVDQISMLPGERYKKRLHINNPSYFNSGVLLLNLQEMRENNVAEKLIFYRQNGINHCQDQDAYNVIIGGNVRYLSFYNNFQLATWHLFDKQKISCECSIPAVNDKYEWMKYARIIHFNSLKPWKYYDFHYADVWLHYYLKSPYNHVPLKRQSIKNTPSVSTYAQVYVQKGYNIYPDDIFSQTNPFLSIILHVSESAQSIIQIIDSLRRQSFIDFEVIIAIDRTTDESSFFIIKDCISIDHRFKVLYINNDLTKEVFNTVSAQAKGKYTIILDSDVKLEINALETYCFTARSSDVKLCVLDNHKFREVIHSHSEDEACVVAPERQHTQRQPKRRISNIWRCYNELGLWYVLYLVRLKLQTSIGLMMETLGLINKHHVKDQ